MSQVVNNLLDNARSFSPPGATVRVNLRRDGDELEITVDDDGPGIPPHALERIFERFYTDRPDHGFGQNSGLGLSISARSSKPTAAPSRPRTGRCREAVMAARRARASSCAFRR